MFFLYELVLVLCDFIIAVQPLKVNWKVFQFFLSHFIYPAQFPLCFKKYIQNYIQLYIHKQAFL